VLSRPAVLIHVDADQPDELTRVFPRPSRFKKSRTRGSPRRRTLVGECWASFRFWWSAVLFAGRPQAARPRAGLVYGLILALIAGITLFTGLGGPLLDPDEGRSAEIAREMLAHHDLLVPRMLGAPYYEKPPLHYWLLAGAYYVFGLHSWAARLVPASAALFALLATFLWGRRALGDRPAFLGTLLLGLSAGFVLIGRLAVLDSLLCLCVITAWHAAHAAVAQPVLRARWWIASAVTCGLGILAKGPVALVLLVPPVVAYLSLVRGKARPGWTGWIGYIGVVLLVAVPWYAAMAYHEPESLRQFLWKANVLRFFQAYDHQQPIWFYGPVLFGFMFPWSLLWPALGVFLLRQRAGIAMLRCPALGYCVLTAGWCLLFFSASGCKSPAYILPALPPLALLLGTCLDGMLFQVAGNLDRFLNRARRRLPRWAVRTLLAMAAVLFLARAWFGWQTWRWAGSEAALTVVLALVWEHYGRRLSPLKAWGVCAVGTLALLLVPVRGVIDDFAVWNTPAVMARKVLDRADAASVPVVSYERLWPAASFYLRRDVIPFYAIGNRPQLLEYLQHVSEACILVEKGPHLEALLEALPEALPAEVHSPDAQHRVTLVVVHHRS
jgi:4-amino-4-deoxy-L-arabinose transferase-like glycosyltransferase